LAPPFNDTASAWPARPRFGLERSNDGEGDADAADDDDDDEETRGRGWGDRGGLLDEGGSLQEGP
jgi:hypothetical protein